MFGKIVRTKSTVCCTVSNLESTQIPPIEQIDTCLSNRTNQYMSIQSKRSTWIQIKAETRVTLNGYKTELALTIFFIALYTGNKIFHMTWDNIVAVFISIQKQPYHSMLWKERLWKWKQLYCLFVISDRELIIHDEFPADSFKKHGVEIFMKLLEDRLTI